MRGTRADRGDDDAGGVEPLHERVTADAAGVLLGEGDEREHGLLQRRRGGRAIMRGKMMIWLTRMCTLLLAAVLLAGSPLQAADDRVLTRKRLSKR